MSKSASHNIAIYAPEGPTLAVPVAATRLFFKRFTLKVNRPSSVARKVNAGICSTAKCWNYLIMPEDTNKGYVKRYVDRANATGNEAEKNNCLYRAGTQMEVIECNGNDQLTPEQQQTVLDAAKKLLEG